MAIEIDKVHRTGVRIDYSRTGNTLNRRERRGVKDIDGVQNVTFDETTNYVGKDATAFLNKLKSQESSMSDALVSIQASHTEEENKISSQITFMSDQITEIEALL